MNDSSTPEVLLETPDSVREEVLLYRTRLEAYLQNKTTPAAFRAYRVPMGIYEQRTNGRFMVRVRIGAGRVRPEQLRHMAELSQTYGNGSLHVTTRQDIQIHELALEDTPSVLEGLLEAGLNSRGGGGNTVRNITACPRSGVCPYEHFDVGPYAVATAEYFLRQNTSFSLPRKYKIAFSGCGNDCAFASVTDLGFFACRKGGKTGFSIFAAGGLGRAPRPGIQLEEFVPATEFLSVAETIRRVFDQYGDRSDRNKARLRHIVSRMGEARFRALYHETRKTLEIIQPVVSDPYAIPGHKNISCKIQYAHGAVLPEKESEFTTLALRLEQGDITAKELTDISIIAERFGTKTLRTTQNQQLLITHIATKDVESIIEAINAVNTRFLDTTRPIIIACTGASTCKLGLCLSRNLAKAIDREFANKEIVVPANFAPIRISGCPNQCGGHGIAAIGLEGSARRINGRLMPHYSIFLGAMPSSNGARLSERVATVPARRIPELFTTALTHGSDIEKQLRDLAAAFETPTGHIPEDYYYDYGADSPFTLEGRGPGECGAGAIDIIKADILEAEAALNEARKSPPSLTQDKAYYRVLTAATRSLLVLFGVDARNDHHVFEAFDANLIIPGWVRLETRSLLAHAVAWRETPSIGLSVQQEVIAELLERVKALFHSLNGNLKFTLEPFQTAPAPDTPVMDTVPVVDLRGVACPLNFVKAKIALEKIPVGDTLDVLLDDGEPIRNVPASFSEQGHEVLEILQEADHHRLRIRRLK